MANAIVIKGNLRNITYVNARGEQKTLTPKDILSFSKYDLDFDKQANYYGLLAQLADEKNRQLEDLKVKKDTLHANLYQTYINDDDLKKLNNGRKPSEAMIESSISLDEKFYKYAQAVAQLESDNLFLKRMLKGLELKMSMMQTASAENRIDINKHA